MSSNFGHIPLLTAELASKNRCCHFFMVAIDQIHFKFVVNERMHNISHEFEFRPHLTTDYELSALECLKYPLKKDRLIMGKMVSPLFLQCLWCDPFDTCR